MSGPGRRPLVGISLGYRDFDDYLAVGFHRPIVRAGGVAVTIPRLEEGLQDILERCDGLMLAGGHDISPEHYRQRPHALLGKTDPHRDRFELDLVRRAIDQRIPVIGVCRGIQVLNVAFGGTLVQDVSLVPEWADHPSDPTWSIWRTVERASLEDGELPAHPRHPIEIEHGSLLHAALGTTRTDVSSFHHQAVDTVAAGLRVTARAPDGLVEALEAEGSFVLGMQCELHEDWRVRPELLAVFESFVAAAAGRAARRRAPERTRA